MYRTETGTRHRYSAPVLLSTYFEVPGTPEYSGVLRGTAHQSVLYTVGRQEKNPIAVPVFVHAQLFLTFSDEESLIIKSMLRSLF